jgi:ubiquinone/menaquinone biosynthesis C-methylase UbiE
MTGDYEYRGLVAEAWDLLRGDTSNWPDRAFYRALIQHKGGPALDVGCGTGRLLLDYLEFGLDIDGVDNSPEMLALCRAKAADLGIALDGRLFAQEMDQLDLPRRYATILVPSSSFQLLVDSAAADRALARFHAHLQPGGLLVMSIMSKLWPGRRKPSHMEWSEWHKLGEKERADGTAIRRWIRGRYDHENQLQHEENRYEVLSGGEVIHSEFHSRSPAVRWYSQAQALQALEHAGFYATMATSGFTLDPASADDTTFCVMGTK